MFTARLAVCVVVVAACISSSAQAEEPLKEQQRYVDAAVALGCNVARYGGSHNDSAREKANTATLRKHGLTRTSYMMLAARLGSNAKTQGEVNTGLTRCEGVQAFTEGHYRGKFEQGRDIDHIKAEFSVRIRSGRLFGYVQGSAGQQPFKFTVRATKAIGSYAHFEGRLGGSSGFGYRMEIQQKGAAIKGTAVLSFASGGTYIVPINATL